MEGAPWGAPSGLFRRLRALAGSCLEVDPQAQLNLPGVVDLVGNLSEVLATHLVAGRRELHAVEDVEELSAELQIGRLIESSRFLDRNVEILDAVRAKSCVSTGLVAEAVAGIVL